VDCGFSNSSGEVYCCLVVFFLFPILTFVLFEWEKHYCGSMELEYLFCWLLVKLRVCTDRIDAELRVVFMYLHVMCRVVPRVC